MASDIDQNPIPSRIPTNANIEAFLLDETSPIKMPSLLMGCADAAKPYCPVRTWDFGIEWYIIPRGWDDIPPIVIWLVGTILVTIAIALVIDWLIIMLVPSTFWKLDGEKVKPMYKFLLDHVWGVWKSRGRAVERQSI